MINRLSAVAAFTVALSVLAVAFGRDDGQAIQRINPPGLSTPATYAHIVRAGKTLYIAGQVGANAEGKVVDVQQRQKSLMETFRNVRSNGADLDPKTGVRMPRRE